ncbi:TetR/AcrR family transcriptional regulator [Nocardia asteroides]|uniref:TetR/AcrR family transcriptional regulator n=1 Tax=Nocardia asteroides TaxID=1824 RepID=UPI0033C791D3
MTAERITPTRTDRRRVRTRNALLGAARKFLSEGRSAVSIKEITDAADVGFGSFYNHFDSKEQLFDEAAQSALQVYARCGTTLWPATTTRRRSSPSASG